MINDESDIPQQCQPCNSALEVNEINKLGIIFDIDGTTVQNENEKDLCSCRYVFLFVICYLLTPLFFSFSLLLLNRDNDC